MDKLGKPEPGSVVRAASGHPYCKGPACKQVAPERFVLPNDRVLRDLTLPGLLRFDGHDADRIMASRRGYVMDPS